MNEDDKKITTEWLGEFYHKIEVYAVDFNFPGRCYCGQGALYPVELDEHIRQSNRTFTAPADFFACFNRLVENKQLGDFLDSIRNKFYETPEAVFQLQSEDGCGYDDFTTWYHSKLPDGTYRLCSLIPEAIRAGVIKGGKG